MSLLFAQSNQLYLDILSDAQELSWQESQKMRHPDSCWRLYLNRLFVDNFLLYVEEEYSWQPQIWQQNKLEKIWSLVDGTVVLINNKRFLLLPTETIDNDEVTIPQEWIDIPSWIADYYLIAQVNPDEQWIRIKGYTTHATVKNQATYDAIERLYHLDGNQIIEDLSVLWLSQEFCPEEITKIEVNPLPNLPIIQAENLIERLANSEILFPRLEIPFSLWGTLVENDNHREKLFQLREGLNITNTINKLTGWFDNLFNNLWQTPEELNLFFAVSRSSTLSTIKRAKLIDLEECNVILVVEITQENEQRYSIRIQLYPDSNNRYLSPNIIISLLSASGQILKSTQAGHEDNYIAINKFTVPANFQFQIQIQLDSLTKIEEFII